MEPRPPTCAGSIGVRLGQAITEFLYRELY